MDIKIILLNTIIGLKNSKINIYTYKKTYLQQKCNEIQINLQRMIISYIFIACMNDPPIYNGAALYSKFECTTLL